MLETRVVLHRWADMPPEAVTDSITRKFITAERITLAHFELKQGGVVPRHKHESEQLSYVLRGALKFEIGGEGIVVRGGEVLEIPSWVEHRVDVLEDALVVDVFSPPRKDWVDRTDTYFAEVPVGP
jgi:quercetin dioxygenase-like cupin family protein